MTRKIIGFAGQMHSGKDTSGDYLCAVHDFRRFAFADALKAGVQGMTGFTTEQCWGPSKDTVDDFWGVSPRVMLQDVGVFMRQTYRDDFWACRLRKFAQDNPDTNIVVTDARFRNEADLIHELGGYVVRIHRANTHQDSTTAHVSEQQDFVVDNVVHNNGTYGELYIQIDQLMNQLYSTPIPETLADGRHFMDETLIGGAL